MNPSPPSATTMSALSAPASSWDCAMILSAACASGMSAAVKCNFMSAACEGHGPCQRRLGMAAIDDEVVPLRLAPNRFVDGLVENGVVLRRPQRPTQIGRVVLAETHEQRSGAGEAHAVAALTEIVGEGRDEAKATPGLLHLDIARRTAGAVPALFHCEPARQ